MYTDRLAPKRVFFDEDKNFDQDDDNASAAAVSVSGEPRVCPEVCELAYCCPRLLRCLII